MDGNIPSWKEWNEDMTMEQRHYHLHNVLVSLDRKLGCQIDKCNVDCSKKFKALEDRKVTDKIFAGFTGFIGGFAAFFSKNLF